MILLDTNIFIYIANSTLQTSVIANQDIAFATISKIEALGYHQLIAQEESRLSIIFSKAQQIELSSIIAELAIQLRREKSMSLGDAIVAATALENNLVLWTANTQDFEHISDLKLHNPLNDRT